MKLAYSLSLSDYIAAIRLHRDQEFGRRFMFRASYIWLPIVSGAGLITALVLWKLGSLKLSSGFIPAETVLLLLSIALPLARIPDVRICFKRIFPDPRNVPTINLAFDEEGFRSEIPGVSEGIFRWNALVGFAQNDTITLLYLAKKKFLFFPTSIMSSEQRSELKDLIDRKVRKRQMC